MNSKKMARREAMGDKMGMSMAPQPLPGAPQNQKGGNVANYPAMDVNGQMGQQMGSGGAMLPYGDMQLDAQGQAALGNVGFTGVSGQAQNIVPGRAMNMPMAYNTQPQPDAKAQMLMEPMYEINTAEGKTIPGGGPNKLFGAGNQAPYFITSMGPTGGTVEMAAQGQPTVPGQIPMQMTSSSRPGTLGLQGTQSAEAGSTGGMSTGRGGGRNKGKN